MYLGLVNHWVRVGGKWKNLRHTERNVYRNGIDLYMANRVSNGKREITKAKEGMEETSTENSKESERGIKKNMTMKN